MPTHVPPPIDLQVAFTAESCPDMPFVGMLRYQPAVDPYMIEIDFLVGPDEPVNWKLARELLADGICCRCGEGDVVIWPLDNRVPLDSVAKQIAIELNSPSGHAVFYASRASLLTFLRCTYASVPAGEESSHLDIEGELAELFGLQ